MLNSKRPCYGINIGGFAVLLIGALINSQGWISILPQVGDESVNNTLIILINVYFPGPPIPVIRRTLRASNPLLFKRHKHIGWIIPAWRSSPCHQQTLKRQIDCIQISLGIVFLMQEMRKRIRSKSWIVYITPNALENWSTFAALSQGQAMGPGLVFIHFDFHFLFLYS